MDHLVLEDGPLAELLHLPQGVHDHLALLHHVVRGHLRQLLQVRLAVGQLGQLTKHHKELRHVGGRQVGLAVGPQRLAGDALAQTCQGQRLIYI